MLSRMRPLLPYLLVGVGGFVGANVRFVQARWIDVLHSTNFPVGTFTINVAGSFLLGLLGAFVSARVPPPTGDHVRLALGVGFLGAYTTFSTFEYETHALLEDGSWLTGFLNVFFSLFVGLVAVRLGILAARHWFSAVS
jgi:fluoride exporter